jgi:hypothetical protein
MVIDLTRLSTVAARQIDRKKTEVTTHSAEAIKWSWTEKLLDVSENAHLGQTTDIIPGQLGKRNQKQNVNGLEQVQESRVYFGRRIPETR